MAKFLIIFSMTVAGILLIWTAIAMFGEFGKPECPRESKGYRCHADYKSYNYTCEECGRSK